MSESSEQAIRNRRPNGESQIPVGGQHGFGKNGPSLRDRTGSVNPGRRGSRQSKRAWWVVAATLLSAAGFGFASLASSQPAAVTQEPARLLAVRTVTIEPVTSYQAAREYTGTIVARRASALGFELAGKLTELGVSEGDSVATGEVLARLDTEHLETNRRRVAARRAQAAALRDEMIAGPRVEDIAAARARVESLEAQVELLKLQTVRHKRLLTSKATSQDEYEQHSFALKARRAQLNAARHGLEELVNGTRREQIEAQRAVVAELDAAIAAIDVDLRKSQLTAPFDGTIARRLADDGTVVEAGQPVFRLVEDQALEAWIGVPAHAIGQLATGSPQRLNVRGEYIDAKVAGQFPEVDPATRTRTVVLELDSTAFRSVVHGQVVRLELEETVPTDGFWLPLTALTRGARGLWTALVAESEADTNKTSQNGSFRVGRRDLEVLHTESDQALVRGPLHPGDRVIANGTHRVVPGQLVRFAR